MPNEINILHVSDLHYSTRSKVYDREQVVSAFLNDVKSFCTNYLTIDLVIFSGDLVYSADEEDVYYHLYDKFISLLSKATRCDEGRIFLCPGNHDVQQSVVKATHDNQSQLLASVQTREALNLAYANGFLCDFAAPRFERYFDLAQYCGHSTPVYADQIISVQCETDLSLDVICLNTAWSSWAGLPAYGSDERKLLLPEQAISRAIANSANNHFKLFVSHHPLSWLSADCERDSLATMRTLQGQMFIHLFGHMHEAQPQQLSTLQGQWLSAQSGALYTERSRYNGYSVVSVDLDQPHPVINYRSYFDTSMIAIFCSRC